MKNTFGNAISLTIFGESHGPAVGAVLDGLAAGLPVDEEAIAAAMDRRRARGDGLSTARTEADAVEFLSGVYQGHTTGTAITMMIRNLNTRSGDYAKTADLLRPGHADYTAHAKYEGWQDARGGGHFSGRITAASVAAGALCEEVLKGLGIRVYTHIAACAGVEDAPLSSAAGLVLPEPEPGHFALLDPTREAAMQQAIRTAGSEGDSVGGILETIVTGVSAMADAMGTAAGTAGTALDTDQILRGNPLNVKFDRRIPEMVDTVIENGIEHHYVVVHGDIMDKLRLFAKWMDLEIL